MRWAGETGRFVCTQSVLEAAAGADVLYNRRVGLMGQEGEAAARRAAFAGYQINDAAMAAAKPDAIVLHCLPAHREEEINAKVFEAHAKEIFDEAENRLHGRKPCLSCDG
jgi:ornithine carbamoyltransferase